MIAALCLLVPPLISILISTRLTQRHESKLYVILWYIIYTVILNGVIWIILRLFFTHGDRLIYNLNHSRVFSLKYIALSLALAVACPILMHFYKSICEKLEVAWEHLKNAVRKFSKPLKVGFFILIGIVLFETANFIIKPVWIDDNHTYDATSCFYNEPQNTIETVFLGASIVEQGIAPMELYDNYGICSYNLAKSNQPIMASYYWLKEVYRLHPETFDTAVLDVSLLRNKTGDSWYKRTLGTLQLSPVKIQAAVSYGIKDIEEETPIREYVTEAIQGAMQILSPMYCYHDRWKELESSDFFKTSRTPDAFNRGYNFTLTSRIDSVSNITGENVPTYLLDESATPTQFFDEAVEYFDKMVEFCSDHDIRLVLIKTPVNGGWSSANHLAAQELADAYDLDFLDFNFAPLIDVMGYHPETDSRDGSHMNYFGAEKLTQCLGEYLVEVCGNKDVRGDARYDFMNDELSQYKNTIVDYKAITDPADYLNYMTDKENYEIFISVKDDGAKSLTDDQRETFKKLGLKKLSEIEFRDSYLAVIENGTVLWEELAQNIEPIENNGSSGDYEKENEELEPLSYSGIMSDGISYTITSGGNNLGNKSSIEIGGKEYSNNTRGINIVVWDKRSDAVQDQVAFDTYSSSKRTTRNTSDLYKSEINAEKPYTSLTSSSQKLYQYDLYWSDKKLKKYADLYIANDEIIPFIDLYSQSDDLAIFISTQGDVSEILTAEDKTALRKIGLRKLAGIKADDYYAAAIWGQEIIDEEISRGESDAVVLGVGQNEANNVIGYQITSGIKDEKLVSSIIIESSERSPAKDGINIVVYDVMTKAVVDSRTIIIPTDEQSE